MTEGLTPEEEYLEQLWAEDPEPEHESLLMHSQVCKV